MIESNYIISFSITSTFVLVFALYLFEDVNEPKEFPYKRSKTINWYFKVAIISFITQIACFLFFNSYVFNNQDILSAKVSYDLDYLPPIHKQDNMYMQPLQSQQQQQEPPDLNQINVKSIIPPHENKNIDMLNQQEQPKLLE